MRHDDRRPDFVEQFRASLAPRQMLDIERTCRSLVRRRRRTSGRAALTSAAGTTGPAWPCAAAGRGTGRRWIHDVAAALRGDELRHIRCAGYAFAGPLRVVLPVGVGLVSRREDELPLQSFHRTGTLRDRAVQLRVLRRAPVTRAIDDVDLVALGNEMLEPAG